MERNKLENSQAGQLTRLMDQAADGPADARLWQRLNMERVARRVIQTARLAAAEHAMTRLVQLIRPREETDRAPADGEGAAGRRPEDGNQGRASA